ncbi:hypothetical protein OG234_13090 [Streptomyces sp. NBC_01420]|uniref:hypothetical protein n=1 Tax=Streptomyces sp. NBC_01420 TaxID=2903858 RepID=UPI003248802D
MNTMHVLYDTGAVAEVETTGDVEDYPLPAGAEVITAEEYAQRLADIQAAQQAAADEVAAQEEQQQSDDYAALLALGVPEATARRMSGYTGPTEEEV